ncbi:MAG: Dna2/Cas4 domain-containing protein [Candidatus Poseidoniales archaeon]|nr:MAG: Dna2/Cas4 domain-containing protein [Candidatus Poseidoniales archaeon]
MAEESLVSNGSKNGPYEARLHNDDIWRDESGVALRLSASDLERHEYCPLSWALSREGNSGQGEAIEAGIQKHAEIHAQMEAFKQMKFKSRRATIIWTWWFSITVVFVIDGLAFNYIDDVVRTPVVLARYLAMWSLVLLMFGLIATYLPWRNLVGWNETIAQTRTRILREHNEISPVFEQQNFIGGWFEAGRIEVSLLFAAIVTGLHAIALVGAENRSQATFILFLTAMGWTLAASYQLQRVLLSENAIEAARVDIDLDQGSDVAYSDDDTSTNLLVDERTGLRGRPDQIVIVDGEFIPVEQKTGKIPKRPHDSHRMQVLAYLHLVEVSTKKPSPYGVIRYGKENLHQIDWNQTAKDDLFSAISEVQRLMVEGGAKRNHERVGKCQNCSRRYACDDSLV